MMKGTLLSRLALLCAVASLCGCNTVDGAKTDTAVSSVPAPDWGWRLPKTVLDTTVTWTPTSCDDSAKTLKFSTAIAVTIVARGAPDTALGSKFPGGLVTLKGADAQSFWIDTNFTYKLIPGRGGLLQSLSSHSTGETGTIVGNFLTGLTKIASLAAAAPLAAAAAPEKCGAAKAILDQIKKLRAQVQTDDAKAAQDDGARIQALKDSITVTKKISLDVGFGDDAVRVGGLVRPLQPDQGDIEAAGWYSKGTTEAANPPDDQKVKIWLDPEHGALCSVCITQADRAIPPQPLAEGALFRQAAYIPVYVESGPWTAATGHGTALGDRQIVAFGQFGQGKTLPIKVKSFQDINWEVDFTELGEVTTATFASKATGVGISNLFASAAGAASTVQSTLATASTAPSTETSKLTKENAGLKAQIDNKTLKAQLEALGTPTTGTPSQ